MYEIEASNYRPDAAGTRRGYVDITLTSAGLRIRDCIHHLSCDNDGWKEWIELPARPMLNNGHLKLDQHNHVRYAKIFAFTSGRSSRAFQRQALEAVYRHTNVRSAIEATRRMGGDD